MKKDTLAFLTKQANKDVGVVSEYHLFLSPLIGQYASGRYPMWASQSPQRTLGRIRRLSQENHTRINRVRHWPNELIPFKLASQMTDSPWWIGQGCGILIDPNQGKPWSLVDGQTSAVATVEIQTISIKAPVTCDRDNQFCKHETHKSEDAAISLRLKQFGLARRFTNLTGNSVSGFQNTLVFIDQYLCRCSLG